MATATAPPALPAWLPIRDAPKVEAAAVGDQRLLNSLSKGLSPRQRQATAPEPPTRAFARQLAARYPDVRRGLARAAALVEWRRVEMIGGQPWAWRVEPPRPTTRGWCTHVLAVALVTQTEPGARTLSQTVDQALCLAAARAALASTRGEEVPAPAA